jgi:hypothetical protein
VENHRISFYIEQIQPVQARLKSNMETVMSDISYLALLNHTTNVSQLRDSIWRSLSFDVGNVTKAFKQSARLEADMRKNLTELGKINSEKNPALQAVKSTSAMFVRNAAEMYSILNLHLRGHLRILPQLDKMADLLVEFVLVGRNQASYDRLNKQYKQVIERALSDLSDINGFIGPMKEQIATALSIISQSLNDANKQKKSGNNRQFIGRMASTAGAGFFVVGTATGLKLAITGAAIVGNPVIGLMVSGFLLGAGGIAAKWNGEEIQINADDLIKTLKAMRSFFDEIMTLTNDQRKYLLEMQGHWQNQQMFLNVFHDRVLSHLETTIPPFSETEINEIRQIQHQIPKENRRIAQSIKNVLDITPSVDQPKQERLDRSPNEPDL